MREWKKRFKDWREETGIVQRKARRRGSGRGAEIVRDDDRDEVRGGVEGQGEVD